MSYEVIGQSDLDIKHNCYYSFGACPRCENEHSYWHAPCYNCDPSGNRRMRPAARIRFDDGRHGLIFHYPSDNAVYNVYSKNPNGGIRYLFQFVLSLFNKSP